MSLPQLGETRSSRKKDHLLQTPDTFVRAALPGMQKALAIVHCAPVLGSAFTQYTAEIESGGRLGGTSAQRFLYVLDGQLAIGDVNVAACSFAFVPQGHSCTVEATANTRAMVIEKPYVPVSDVPEPAFFVGNERDVAAQSLGGDPDLLVRSLIPGGWSFDFAVNTMTYQPGAALSMVEIHVMEHGLFMLEGGGIYRLGDSWYPVTAGDFIWMAPYCPQWFGALGKKPAKYLIYKDWNRHPL